MLMDAKYEKSVMVCAIEDVRRPPMRMRAEQYRDPGLDRRRRSVHAHLHFICIQRVSTMDLCRYLREKEPVLKLHVRRQ